MGPACEVSHLSCFALLLCPDFIFTPAVPLFFFALTLLCLNFFSRSLTLLCHNFFSCALRTTLLCFKNFFFRAHLPCCAITRILLCAYPAVRKIFFFFFF